MQRMPMGPTGAAMENSIKAPRGKKELLTVAPGDSAYERNFSNRSFLALQIGHTSGGCSRAQRYPQTLQRQMGNGRDFTPTAAGRAKAAFLSSDEGLRSGIEDIIFFPSRTSFETYKAQ